MLTSDVRRGEGRRTVGLRGLYTRSSCPHDVNGVTWGSLLLMTEKAPSHSSHWCGVRLKRGQDSDDATNRVSETARDPMNRDRSNRSSRVWREGDSFENNLHCVCGEHPREADTGACTTP